MNTDLLREDERKWWSEAENETDYDCRIERMLLSRLCESRAINRREAREFAAKELDAIFEYATKNGQHVTASKAKQRAAELRKDNQ